MTRKDYVLIAAALAMANGQDHDTPAAAIAYVARALCAELARDNARFDRDRFLKAAGVQS